jgi:hypothetical protein
MRTCSRKFLLVVIALGSVGCASTQVAPRPFQPSTAAESETFVRAVNRNYEDLELHLMVNGSEMLLGSLPALSARTFVVPSRYLAADGTEYQLTARPRGASARLHSPSFPMHRGQYVSWTIEYQPKPLRMARAD